MMRVVLLTILSILLIINYCNCDSTRSVIYNDIIDSIGIDDKNNKNSNNNNNNHHHQHDISTGCTDTIQNNELKTNDNASAQMIMSTIVTRTNIKSSTSSSSNTGNNRILVIVNDRTEEPSRSITYSPSISPIPTMNDIPIKIPTVPTVPSSSSSKSSSAAATTTTILIVVFSCYFVQFVLLSF